MHTTDTLARAGRSGALIAAPLGLVSLVLVIIAEASGAMSSMNAPVVIAASAAGLVSAVALLFGLLWLHRVTAPAMGGRGGGAMVAAIIGAALVVGVLLWAVTARRTGAVPRGVATTLIIGGLLCIAPLPARSLVVAIGMLLLARSAAARTAVPSPAV